MLATEIAKVQTQLAELLDKRENVQSEIHGLRARLRKLESARKKRAHSDFGDFEAELDAALERAE